MGGRYSPFVLSLDGRNFSATSYRYGFQNQEIDNEIKGDGNSVNFTYRMHDPRLGRFFAVDPLTNEFPYWSPYVFCGNQVIWSRELEGKEVKNGSVNTIEAVTTKDGKDGDMIGMTDWHSGTELVFPSLLSENQARTFAQVAGGMVQVNTDINEVKVVVPTITPLGKQVQKVLMEKHNIANPDIELLISALTWRWNGYEDKSSLFSYQIPMVQLANVSIFAIAIPRVAVGVLLPGMSVPTSQVFVDVDALAEQVAQKYMELVELNQIAIDAEVKAQEIAIRTIAGTVAQEMVSNFAHSKRGKQSPRQEEVRHGGPSEGVKGKGGKGDKHTKRKPGDKGEKKRQKGWKDFKSGKKN